MSQFSRRQVLGGAAGLAAATLVGSGRSALADTRKLIFTEPGHSVDSLPFYVGIRKGYYKEVGLDIQLVTSEGGGKAMAAVQSGNADAYIGGPEHIAFADLKGGQPINAVVALSNRANSFVCARTGVSVDPSKPFAENIKGKKIAVGTRGSTDNSVLLYLLKRDGLDPRTDVVMLEIETSAGRIAAMKNGQADMAMVFEPFISQGVKSGIWQEPFASMPKELGLFSWTTVNLPEKTIKADPELAKAIVAATKKSLELIFSNEAEMRAIAAEEFPTLPKEDLDAIMTRARDNDMWQRDGSMPEEAWTKLESILTISGMINQKVPYKQIFDPSFL
ncbi:ABC transporter substrate-binding protein [Rhizobium sp. BK376]|uniref:ABC transporter substrate-binding protein n=1 Tax=Rhizobium sp. BK376 TaxID=2512149 RepID=UPI0010DC5DBE|nr:ABC transporter substrate-binding protein [Rhizobium sp. BK376]TCR69563.1 ABC-type nitrate/sulfonate/bicarbonate transport system substrate-binding protein [Rhizobium sp. BK376]